MRNLGPIIVSAVVTCGFVLVVYMFLAKPIALNEGAKEVLTVLVGTLAAGFTQVIGYWLGSSAGSSRKDEVIASNLPKQPPPSGG